MNSIAPLTGSHLRTYNTLFQHPISHDLVWTDVQALFREIGSVSEEPNGNFKLMRNGESLVMHAPRGKSIPDVGELMKIRHFLERSDAVPASVPVLDAHVLLVIDHQEARLFRALAKGGIPEFIVPHALEDYFRHSHNSVSSTHGQERPDTKSFFEPIAQALHSAEQVLIFGSGTGTSSAMDQFTRWTETNHPELARRIIGTVIIDQHHRSDAQLLSKAREFYTHSVRTTLL